MFYTEHGTEITGIIRTFSPASMSTLPSDLLVLVHGKFAFTSTHGTGKDEVSDCIVEPISYAPFTMDLESEHCDSFLPIDMVPALHFLGTVVGSVIHFNDGAKGIDVRVNNYIQSRMVDSTYRSVFFSIFVRCLS